MEGVLQSHCVSLDGIPPNLDGQSAQDVDLYELPLDQGEGTRNALDLVHDGSWRKYEVELANPGVDLEDKARHGVGLLPGGGSVAGNSLNSCGSFLSGLDVNMLKGSCDAIATAIVGGCNVAATILSGGCNVVSMALSGGYNACVSACTVKNVKPRDAQATWHLLRWPQGTSAGGVNDEQGQGPSNGSASNCTVHVCGYASKDPKEKKADAKHGNSTGQEYRFGQGPPTWGNLPPSFFPLF